MIKELATLAPRIFEDALLDNERQLADPELNLLDPPAGSTTVVAEYSIKSLSGHHLGVGALYDLIGTDIQLGIRLTDRNFWGLGYGTSAVKQLTEVAFSMFGVSRVWLKVLPNNNRAIACYVKSGFVPCGRILLAGYDFLAMEVRR